MYFQKYNPKFLEIASFLHSVDLTNAISIRIENYKTINIDYGVKSVKWSFESAAMAEIVKFRLQLGYNQEPMLMAIFNDCKERTDLQANKDLLSDVKNAITANIKFLEYETKRAKHHIKMLKENTQPLGPGPQNYHEENTKKLIKEVEKYLELIDWTAEIFQQNERASD